MDYTGAGLYQTSQVREALESLEKTYLCNTHSTSDCSARSMTAISEARSAILNFFNADPSEYAVIFTGGATSGLKLLAESFPWSHDSLYVYARDDHNSVIGIRGTAASRGAHFHVYETDQLYKALEDDSVLDLNRIFQHKIRENSEEENIELDDTNHVYTIEDATDNSGMKHNGDNTVYHLFSFPAESNFDGKLYPLEIIDKLQAKCSTSDSEEDNISACDSEDISKHPKERWLVLLDAAAFVSTNRLDLSKYHPDFVTLSFYKMFGYPTGIGALIVRRIGLNPSAKISGGTGALQALRKVFFGGGTVFFASCETGFCAPDTTEPSTQHEDGTLNFTSMGAVTLGLRAMSNYKNGDKMGIDAIHDHSISVARYLVDELNKLKESNEFGENPVDIYGNWDKNIDKQGAIVAFSLYTIGGKPIGYNTALSELDGIQLRGGCHCNPGGCLKALGLAEQQIRDILKFGCLHRKDTLGPNHLGAIRASFGPASTKEDVDKLIAKIKEVIKNESDKYDENEPVKDKDFENFLRGSYFGMN